MRRGKVENKNFKRILLVFQELLNAEADFLERRELLIQKYQEKAKWQKTIHWKPPMTMENYLLEPELFAGDHLKKDSVFNAIAHSSLLSNFLSCSLHPRNIKTEKTCEGYCSSPTACPL